MTGDEIHSVSVVGAGNMGHGIAEVIAIAGYDVTLYDVDEKALAEGYEQVEQSLQKLSDAGVIDDTPEDVLSRLDTETDVSDAVEGVDLVVEAVPENMDLKQQIFSDLDEYAPSDALLATNTSSLSITNIGSATDRPSQVVGMHFFNPPVKMALVEVVYGERTSDETAEAVADFAESLDKTPIFVKKDVHGFVVNNVLAPFSVESDYMVSTGEPDIRDVDAAMVHSRGYPMGPFELGDMAGIDVTYEAQTAGGKSVPPLMKEKYEAGEYGRKTGKGYYDYTDGDGVDYGADQGLDVDTLRIEACMINEAASLIERGITTAEAVDTGVTLGAGFPQGICKRADNVGIDVVYHKLRELHEESGLDRHEPSPLLEEMVVEGRTGTVTGEGFYTYDESRL